MSVNTARPAVFLALSVSVFFANSGRAADEFELNTDFLQGVSGVPAVLAPGIKYPAGQYYVDVRLNGTTNARASLTISKEDELAGNICLSPEWLLRAGVLFKTEFYADTFDAIRECYYLEKNKHTQIDFDFGAQAVDFIIPQAYLLDKSDAALWDYGVNGFRLAYSGNFSKSSDDSLNVFGNFDTNLNLGRWVLSSNMNATKNAYGNEFSTNDLTLSTAIGQVRGDFQLGRSQTRTELFSDFGFYGAALRSNSSMRPWSATGYAPLISGVAPSTSRITVSQGGYTIYSKVVPAGPYQLDDISPVGNGDLLVTVEDDSGAKTTTVYPVATLPTLLRPGEYNYNFAIGQKSVSNELGDAFSSSQGMFLLGSFDYGLATTTINMAGILHDKYQAGGVGVTQPLGQWGAFSSNVNLSKAEFDDNTSEQGVSFAFKYAKSFSERTNLQLLTYRYQSAGYREFATFDPDKRNHVNSEKVRYEALLSHRLDGNVHIGTSFWQQSYWDRDKAAIGANLSASTTVFDDVSLYLNGSYSRDAYSNRDDYSASLGVSIPFNIGGLRHYNSNSVGYSRSGGTTFNSGVSATVNERLNYSVNANTNSQGSKGAGASVGYAFDTVQTNLAVSQNRDRTTLSGSLSGSAVVTEESGLLLTKQASDTIAIVKIKDMPGVTFNGSLPTNKDGKTAVYLSSYNPTSININTENVPDEAELLNSSYSVVPTEKAIIYREFGFENIQRYILRVRDLKGNIIKGGSAETADGMNAGFISGNGILLMNLQAKPKHVIITQSNGNSCRVNISILNENTSSVQEVRCEKNS
ncbi:PefC/AfrB family outer membrane usher protein [Aeromonas sobria]|uniref:Fimbrial protein n=1 Tax=Aeromonas sobria TaxID=646 RepID=A0A1S2CM78_AERSO|nr:PefC/AfrB family outer membrane usher protein [Aeromonas sobria]MBS4687109.1 PefC/AfrB family outer membrane usher protein [Aeromonas sobria]OHY88811.1 fimbrial protein [Aeromonas sobria]